MILLSHLRPLILRAHFGAAPGVRPSPAAASAVTQTRFGNSNVADASTFLRPGTGAPRQRRASPNLGAVSKCALLLLVAAVFLDSCGQNTSKTALKPSVALGSVLAEEAINLAGKSNKVAIISHDASWGPASPVEAAFTAELKKRGFSSFIAKAATLGDPMHGGEVGLHPADFAEALQNAGDAGVVVSFAGPPLLTANDAAKVAPTHPPILIVATAGMGDQPGFPGSLGRVEQLLDARIIQLAIVDGGMGPDAPAPKKTDVTHELFARNYSILHQPQ